MKRVFIMMLYGFVFLLVSCSNVNLYNESHLNKGEESVEERDMFKYLSEEDYGVNFRDVIYSHEQLLDLVQDETILEKYDYNFFAEKDLVIFRFNTHYSEGEINVIQARRVNHDIYILILVWNHQQIKKIPCLMHRFKVWP